MQTTVKKIYDQIYFNDYNTLKGLLDYLKSIEEDAKMDGIKELKLEFDIEYEDEYFVSLDKSKMNFVYYKEMDNSEVLKGLQAQLQKLDDSNNYLKNNIEVNEKLKKQIKEKINKFYGNGEFVVRDSI